MQNSGDAPISPLVLDPAQEKALISKVNWRLIPLLFFCYIIAYIDRINVSFAKLHLQEVLKVDPAVFNSVYGLGAGLFFIGYFIFEVPSNLILHRVGARVWIARIMIVWGFVSMAFMFIQSTMMFYVMRFLLGAAEAGFFPGVVRYLTYWYPHRERASTIALFALGGVLAGVVGSPISGAILGMNGMAGLAGWQWLFLIEAIPAVLMGFVVLAILPNRPRDAAWLTAAEKQWVQARLDDDAAQVTTHQHHSLRDAFTSGRIWLFCLLYFLMNVGGYGYELWAPTIVQDFASIIDAIIGFIQRSSLPNWLKSFLSARAFLVGILNAIPYLIAGIAMIFVGRYSDRSGERRWPVAIAAITSAVGFGLSAYFTNPYLALAALALAFAGIKSTIAPLWALATAFLAGPAAAGGIALINSVGNLGGYAGPHLVGVIKDKTGSNLAALLFLGAALFCMGLLALTIRPAQARKG